MSARDTLAALRRGEVPPAEALATFARALASGTVSDAQAGAFAMAVCTGPGLGEAGRIALTTAMAESGARLGWDLPGPILDKHSTGGVGDPVSLILAPALAACGAFVPMISGRGLGHTGGTLDKLEAIPGLRVDLSRAAFADAVGTTGCAIVAASSDLAPADRRLYAIRDVTATVDQIDLITASILSKKLAAGLDALVLDVKCGTGAFMGDRAAAGELAHVLTATARGAGLPARAIVSAMDQPLAPAMGNALEIAAVLDVLDGTETGGRLAEVSVTLGGILLHMAGLSDSDAAGRDRVATAIADGSALARFEAMVAAQGGPSDLSRARDTHLADAPVIRDVCVPEGGTVAAMDGRALGQVVVALGGGRAREDDPIDPRVGFDRIVPLGSRLERGDPICRVHAADEDAADRAARAVLAAVSMRADGFVSTGPVLEVLE